MASEAATAKQDWGGGASPFRVSYGKLMMWFFLVSDALTFSGLLVGYGFMRHKWPDVWPDPGQVFTHFPFIESHQPLLYVGLMTLILIMSSVTMVLAVEAGHRSDKKKVIIWMLFTIIGGLMFVGSQAWEWYHFIHGTDHGALRSVWKEVQPDQWAWVTEKVYGANMTVNEYGPPVFANLFFLITGFHGFHVFSGVVINFIIFCNVISGTYERRGHYEMVEKSGLYWHFVDLVWVFVFTFFYLV